jgi:hypothetical protein
MTIDERIYGFEPKHQEVRRVPREELVRFAAKHEHSHRHVRVAALRPEIDLCCERHFVQQFLWALDDVDAWQYAPEFMARQYAERERKRALRDPARIRLQKEDAP